MPTGVWERPDVRVEITCKVCGKKRKLKPFRAKVQKYCSVKCSNSDRRHPRGNRVPEVEFTCKRCGHKWTGKRYWPRIYCSDECYRLNAAERSFMNRPRFSKMELSLAVVLEPLGYVSTSEEPFFVRCPDKTRVPDWINHDSKRVVEFSDHTGIGMIEEEKKRSSICIRKQGGNAT